jgi:hypothetical protein
MIVKGNRRSIAAFPCDRSTRALPGSTGLQGVLFVSTTKTCCMKLLCARKPGHPLCCQFGVMFASPMTESLSMPLRLETFPYLRILAANYGYWHAYPSFMTFRS